MSFVVDGSEWQFDEWSPQDAAGCIEALLDFVAVSAERRETIWIGDDLQSRPVLGGLDLWAVATRGGPLGLSNEIIQELSAWLGTATHYLDEAEWPDGLDDIFISIDPAAKLENADVAWAHHSVRAGKSVACLGLRSDAVRRTESTHGVVDLRWVRSESGRIAFWRDTIRLEGDSADALIRLATHAYPDIYFYEGSLATVGKLAGGYLASRFRVQECFAVLNDHGKWVFTCAPPALRPEEASPYHHGQPTNHLIEQRFAGYGLNVAPENPDVRLKPRTREAREIELAGKKLYCEWHVKLEPHRNRVHIHAPVADSGDKIIVGIIHEHLPLPG